MEESSESLTGVGANILDKASTAVPVFGAVMRIKPILNEMTAN